MSDLFYIFFNVVHFIVQIYLGSFQFAFLILLGMNISFICMLVYHVSSSVIIAIYTLFYRILVGVCFPLHLKYSIYKSWKIFGYHILVVVLNVNIL